MDLNAIWTEVLNNLRQQMTNATFNGVFAGSKLLEAAAGEFKIQVETEAAKEWLDNRLRGLVARALSAHTSAEVIFSVVVSQHKPIEFDGEIHLRDRRRGNRYFIDRELIFNGYAGVLGPFAVAVYNVLAAHADNDSQDCCLFYSTIAMEAGISDSQAKREMKKLEKYHLIEVDRSKTSKANTYSLLDVSEWRLI